MAIPQELSANELRWQCPAAHLPFETTDDIEPLDGVIGQQRAVEAITLGLELDSEGYNIFVTGLTGADRIPTIEQILEQAKNNSITCRKAEEIAEELGFTLQETGAAIDVLNIKIAKCQLGLFGYGETQKIVQPAKEVSPELKEEITSSLEDERLPCAAAWEIADKFNISRMKVCSACETLQIKIKPCQLGAF